MRKCQDELDCKLLKGNGAGRSQKGQIAEAKKEKRKNTFLTLKL
jgi:hypothetical protein